MKIIWKASRLVTLDKVPVGHGFLHEGEEYVRVGETGHEPDSERTQPAVRLSDASVFYFKPWAEVEPFTIEATLSR